VIVRVIALPGERSCATRAPPRDPFRREGERLGYGHSRVDETARARPPGRWLLVPPEAVGFTPCHPVGLRRFLDEPELLVV
jgi:hypothetical protein